MPYIPRILEQAIRETLQHFCVLGLTGPRQSGKSTLLRQVFPEYEYLTFDDYRVLDFFGHDPEAFMAQHQNQVIFDEAQKAPLLFNYVKMAVDNDRQHYGKFILTGSSQFHLMEEITESLAGRIGLLSLLPMQFSEIPTGLQTKAFLRGAYPEIILQEFENVSAWYGAYLETYLTRDVQSLAHVGDLRDFRRCLNLLAANVGQILNMSNLAKDVGTSVTTIRRWISVLEASYILFLLPPYYQNLGKRIVKSPKVYFWDTGVVAYLLNLDSPLQPQNPFSGHLFENYVISEIHKQVKHSASHTELYYFRTSHGEEVDLLLSHTQKIEWIEIKQTSTLRMAFLDNIRKWMRAGDCGVLLYQGRTESLSPEVQAFRVQDYLLRHQ